MLMIQICYSCAYQKYADYDSNVFSINSINNLYYE